MAHSRRARLALVLLLLSTLVLAACGGSRGGLPTAPGQYTLKEKSVTFDGERYGFFWADAGGALRRAHTDDVKLQLDERNYLEIGADKKAILHLKQDEPVTVEGRDNQGDYGSFWFPFLVGSMLMRGGGPMTMAPAPREYRDPVYRYPPTDRFDRGDTIGGSVSQTRPGTPDYSRLPPVGGTLSGQTGGTGGGNAATNRADAARPSSGQAGGTGSGSAVLDRTGAFKNGSQGYDAKVGSGQIRPITGESGPRIGAGSGRAPTSSSPPRISTGRRR